MVFLVEARCNFEKPLTVHQCMYLPFQVQTLRIICKTGWWKINVHSLLCKSHTCPIVCTTLHHLYWHVINKVSYVTLYGSLLYKRLSPYRQLYKTDISLNWTPRVGPRLSLLRLVDSLEDGHLSKKGHYVLVAKVSITDRVNFKHFELENGVMMTLKHCWIYH